MSVVADPLLNVLSSRTAQWLVRNKMLHNLAHLQQPGLKSLIVIHCCHRGGAAGTVHHIVSCRLFFM